MEDDIAAESREQIGPRAGQRDGVAVTSWVWGLGFRV